MIGGEWDGLERRRTESITVRHMYKLYESASHLHLAAPFVRVRGSYFQLL